MALTRALHGGMAETAGSPRTNLFDGYLTAFRKWRELKTAIAELRGMDDRQLRDMGIGRSEIESLVYFAGRDPTRLRRG